MTIVSVQALRAIAALAVVLCHFDMLGVWLIGQTGPYLLQQLASGVDLFFVISGFIMVYSSGDLFATKGAWFKFLSRRLARIVPLYWVVTVIAIPIMALPSDCWSLLGSFFFVPYRAASDAIAPVYGVGWTLNFEMFFYTMFSMMIFLPRQIAVPLLCATLTIFVVLGYFLQPTFAPLIFWSDRIILEFAFGMMLALFYVTGVRLPISVRIFLVVAGAVAIGLSSNTRPPPTGYRVMEWGIPAAMIFAGTVLGKDINFGWLRAPAQILGNASYALYLTHPLMTAAVFIGWPLGLNQHPKMLVLFLAIVGVQLISIAMYYVFEKRSSRFLQERFRLGIAGH